MRIYDRKEIPFIYHYGTSWVVAFATQKHYLPDLKEGLGEETELHKKLGIPVGEPTGHSVFRVLFFIVLIDDHQSDA
jgi:hypothetical protein